MDKNTQVSREVSRNDMTVVLAEGKVTKGRDQYIYFFPKVEGMDAIVKFLGAEDALKLLSDAIKDIGRSIHKTILTNNPAIAIGSSAYVELFQSHLDDWDSTADNKSDLCLQLEELNEIGKSIALQAMATGKPSVEIDYISIYSKEQVKFSYDIEQADGQNGVVSAQLALMDILKKSEAIKTRINAIKRAPKKPKAAVVVTSATAEGTTPVSEPAPVTAEETSPAPVQ